MSLSSKALQQKRTKKAAKRKGAKKSGTASNSDLIAMGMIAASSAPIADVFIPKGLFDTGIGTLWFSRKLDDGSYAMSSFLVDTYCLGVKNALYAMMSPDKYKLELERYLAQSIEVFVTCDPAYLRKLVELAIAYAGDLGFEPHPDYKIAKLIFGNVDASSCDAVFNFGRNGMPTYFQGPNETPADVRRILKQLEKKHKDPIAVLIQGLDDSVFI